MRECVVCGAETRSAEPDPEHPFCDRCLAAEREAARLERQAVFGKIMEEFGDGFGI